ncbi:hypothetical protein TNCV_3962871 [Trichonephila clavipes]|nr:hypothetical protein TNCV_3962871 [Trichonephila clavipes]
MGVNPIFQVTIGFMVLPAGQGQVPHPSIVPECFTINQLWNDRCTTRGEKTEKKPGEREKEKKTGKKPGEREKEKKTGEKTKSPRESEKDEERRWR